MPKGDRRGRLSLLPLPKQAQQQVQPSTLPLDKDDDRVSFLRRCVAPHVDSFDFAVGVGLLNMSEEIEPVFVRGPASTTGTSVLISMRPHSFAIQKPRVSTTGQQTGLMVPLYPAQCRRVGATYRGDLFAGFTIVLDNKESFEIPVHRIGRVPVMVGSSICHLRGRSRTELVAMGEEEYEVGGTFIINGAERVLRLIVVPRPNHAISAQREKNRVRGSLFTDLSLSYRSARRDLSTFTVHLHLLRTGSVRLRLAIDRNEYFIPIGVLMRALLPSGTMDRDIFDLIVGADTNNSALAQTAIAIVKELSEQAEQFRKKDTEPGMISAVSRTAAIAFLGKNFKATIRMDDPYISNYEAGVAFLRKFVFVHLSVGPYERPSDALDRSKVDLMVLLVQKLVATFVGDVEVDNADALSHQSLMPPGQLYLSLLKERIQILMQIVAFHIRKEGEKEKGSNKSSGTSLQGLITEAFKKAVNGDSVSKSMSYLLATGNIKSNTGLDLPQAVGYSVIAERINFLRFICHFRAVHRGAFYAAMRSTKVRKLLPEAWGFICPVHTPDGDPCGILNHLTSTAVLTQGAIANREDILQLFSDFNFVPAPALSAVHIRPPKDSIPVVVDGRVLGFVKENCAEALADQIRYSKVRDAVTVLPDTSEVIYIRPVRAKSGFQPGVYVHTGGCRVMRPVRWLRAVDGTKSQKNVPIDDGIDEWIGSMEQVFLRVRPAFQDQKDSLNPIKMKGATHAEVSSVAFLSVLASLSPFPDMNQGPRNMFQCQMAKQAMGTPCHTVWSRTDSKIYRHTTPQVPIVRNVCMQDPMGTDIYPNGVNAVVAVISYTGNDMEDALIINKGSLDRGFAHGTVYMNERIDLDSTIAGRETKFISLTEGESAETTSVDMDGLPAVGARVKRGSKLYGISGNHSRGGLEDRSTNWTVYKYEEDGTIDEVTIYDGDMYKQTRGPRGNGIRQVNVRTRISRRPTVGDKFASRAGQKGTMSSAWPSEDMPFSESGMMPDILFNPNGFPSRMTIGMMIEIMAGKGGAMHGHFNDSTPFQFDENFRAVDFFGEQLLKAGFDSCGSETLYSGYTGEPFKVNIFTGIVHYQRLRHMVSDKFQVRTTGAIHPLVRQPIKGRRRGGAIRFGEMERDGLLAHGASFLLRDRLAMASDMHILHVCNTCGSILSPITGKNATGGEGTIYCRICRGKEDSRVERVAIPYSFKYLANELAAMNIRTVLKLKEVV